MKSQLQYFWSLSLSALLNLLRFCFLLFVILSYSFLEPTVTKVSRMMKKTLIFIEFQTSKNLFYLWNCGALIGRYMKSFVQVQSTYQEDQSWLIRSGFAHLAHFNWVWTTNPKQTFGQFVSILSSEYAKSRLKLANLRNFLFCDARTGWGSLAFPLT